MLTDYENIRVYHLDPSLHSSDAAILLEFKTKFTAADMSFKRLRFNTAVKKNLSVSCEVHTHATLQEKYPKAYQSLLSSKVEIETEDMTGLCQTIVQYAEQASTSGSPIFVH